MRNLISLIVVIVNLTVLFLFINTQSIGWGITYIISTFLLLLTFYETLQSKHSLKRNFPLVGNIRWVFESQRDKIRQYFNESDLDGKPFNKEQRSIVYQRSKNEIETVPFGTMHNVYGKGHQFVKHSIFPKKAKSDRIMVGTKHCKHPYESSIINISAMSYGSLSGAAVRALNMGAKKGGFAHNTGEGGISEHHLKGGDLIFQIGTGYFGAGITKDGVRTFDDETFAKNAKRPEVKMIEIKLSQGAKPGHGGILPAKKNTEEIAKIRGVEPHTRVDSPPTHSAFSNFDEMVKFIQKVRELSGGKPVGIKLCVTSKQEIQQMLHIFYTHDNYPDFISVDGSEGGTGSAPLEFTNNIGTPMLDGLNIVRKELNQYRGILDDVKLFASGKIIDTFDIVKVMALGADGVNIARGFMLSLGCIQARECNKDTCPVGIATQQKHLEHGLVVNDKYERVYNYHNNTTHKFEEMVGAMGLSTQKDITSHQVHQRMHDGIIKTFAEIYEQN